MYRTFILCPRFVEYPVDWERLTNSVASVVRGVEAEHIRDYNRLLDAFGSMQKKARDTIDDYNHLVGEYNKLLDGVPQATSTGSMQYYKNSDSRMDFLPVGGELHKITIRHPLPNDFNGRTGTKIRVDKEKNLVSLKYDNKELFCTIPVGSIEKSNPRRTST